MWLPLSVRGVSAARSISDSDSDCSPPRQIKHNNASLTRKISNVWNNFWKCWMAVVWFFEVLDWGERIFWSVGWRWEDFWSVGWRCFLDFKRDIHKSVFVAVDTCIFFLSMLLENRSRAIENNMKKVHLCCLFPKKERVNHAMLT